MYQRLGLEDDIVDPSNALLLEGPVLKISFRRRDPAERYLFLVGEVGCHSALGLPRPLCTTRGAGESLLIRLLLWHQLPLDKCCLRAWGSQLRGVPDTPGEPQSRHVNPVPLAPKRVVLSVLWAAQQGV